VGTHWGLAGDRSRAFGGPARVPLPVQADQVSDDNDCAHAHESRQADREQNPDKFNLLGVKVKDAHYSSCVCRREYSAILRWREGRRAPNGGLSRA
jgi:hypothetical protein